MKLTGDINIFLNALGKYKGDQHILDSICVISSHFEINYFKHDNVDHLYYLFMKNGVEFSFNRDKENYYLESIFFYFQASPPYLDYLFKDNLIDGLHSTFTKNDVILLFGKPISESVNWVKYNINSKFIHFEFNEKGITQISLFIE